MSPEVARDKSGVGKVRAGISGELLLAVTCGSAAEGDDCESLRCTPSTKARKEVSSEGDRSLPEWDFVLCWDAVG